MLEYEGYGGNSSNLSMGVLPWMSWWKNARILKKKQINSCQHRLEIHPMLENMQIDLTIQISRFSLWFCYCKYKHLLNNYLMKLIFLWRVSPAVWMAVAEDHYKEVPCRKNKDFEHGEQRGWIRAISFLYPIQTRAQDNFKNFLVIYPSRH